MHPAENDDGVATQWQEAGARRTFKVFGFLAGLLLGICVCTFVVTGESHSGPDIGGSSTLYVFGMKYWSWHGLFAQGVPGLVHFFICVATSIAGVLFGPVVGESLRANR